MNKLKNQAQRNKNLNRKLSPGIKADEPLELSFFQVWSRIPGESDKGDMICY